MKSGDLYYVPQNVLLVQFDNNSTSPKNYYKTDKPLNVVVINEGSSDLDPHLGKLIKVFCNGQKWYVNKNDLFEVQNDGGG
tara:strand:+ start:1894 stop:2136 length:243 start_codon:yes stop_codon:yes gene_type:complete